MLNLSQTHKSIGFCFCLVLCSMTLVKLQSKQLSQKLSTKNTNTYIEQEKHQQAMAVFQKKMPAFGYDNLLADWAYLQFLQYFGDTEARQVTGYSIVTDYFETIVKRDPNFVYAHLNLSSANSIFAAQPEKTVSLIDRVLKTVTPETLNYPFSLWTYKATDEILFLGDLEAARNSYQMAASWASLREDELGEEMANRFHKTAKFLATDPDPTQAQIGAWMTALSSAKDEKTRKYILKKLQDLGMKTTEHSDSQLNIKAPKLVRVNGRQYLYNQQV